MAKTATRGSTTGRAATKSKPGPKPGSTRKPRAAASSATPAPVMPPPTTSTSNASVRSR